MLQPGSCHFHSSSTSDPVKRGIMPMAEQTVKTSGRFETRNLSTSPSSTFMVEASKLHNKKHRSDVAPAMHQLHSALPVKVSLMGGGWVCRRRGTTLTLWNHVGGMIMYGQLLNA